jgi:hypothetical protein
MWAGCVAGALQETEYRRLLAEAGFEDIDIEPTRVYNANDSRDFFREAGIAEADLVAAEGRIMAAFVRARKPA